MLKTIIVDDEFRGRQTLQNLLTDNCPEVQILESCDSAAAAKEAIEKHHRYFHYCT
jgi:two-component system, LytTR family, response regulator